EADGELRVAARQRAGAEGVGGEAVGGPQDGDAGGPRPGSDVGAGTVVLGDGCRRPPGGRAPAREHLLSVVQAARLHTSPCSRAAWTGRATGPRALPSPPPPPGSPAPGRRSGSPTSRCPPAGSSGSPPWPARRPSVGRKLRRRS